MGSSGSDEQKPRQHLSDSMAPWCGCLIFVGVCFGFASTAIIWAMELGVLWALGLAGMSALVVTAAAVRLWQYHHQPDSTPDFLAKLVKGCYADADGFCFHPLASVSQGRLEIQVYFQNRFDRPCCARLTFKPHGFF
jgi:hypothetical protein